MPTLTKNLFWGQGPGEHRLEVIEGAWPTDIDGAVHVVGPDKRSPGGHWFAAMGLLEKIHLRPDRHGRILVQHRHVETRIARIRRRAPWLFKLVEFMELSPFGVTNMANTSLQPIDGRLFVGYDAGRPIEVDPETLDHITPVGGNDEWFQALPGVLEPLVAVAAHPAADHDEKTLYFLNYTQVSAPGTAAESYLARWRLDGPVERWRLEGMSEFDSIHDVKVTEDHVVFADLPFVFEPETIGGAERSRRNQEHTNLWIVAKADLAATPPGGTVKVTEVRIPVPTGHLFVDHEEADGLLRVIIQHIPLADLMITLTRDDVNHADGVAIDPNYEGLVAAAVQPSMLGCYLVDPATGSVKESKVAIDRERLWGGILATSDIDHPEARRRQRQLWYAGLGFDPDLVPETWWRLYGDATDGIVPPADLPTTSVPGTLARIDLDTMEVAEVHSYEDGAFPSPPTFVPRVDAAGPEDGYVVVVVHRDGPKEVQVFDASRISDGPVARASAPTFNPGLLLHSCWMPDRIGPRRSSYRIGLWRDVRGAVGAIPAVLASMFRVGRDMTLAARAGR